jgi:hypothetical protein
MASEWQTVEPRWSRVPGIDPSVEWILDEGATYFYPSENQQQWFPIVVLFKKELREDDFASGERFVDGGWKTTVRVPRLHLAKAADKPVSFCTALVTRDFFDRMLKLWETDPKFVATYPDYIARISIGLPLDDESLPLTQSGEQK